LLDVIRKAEFDCYGRRFTIINKGFTFELKCDGVTVDESRGSSTCELSCVVDGHTVRVDVVMGTMAIVNVFIDGKFLRAL
jgi:hypothetical protein